jgi:glycosyltransferase involved in cell wall biosynthesis
VGGAERTLAELVASGARAGHSDLVLNPFALDPGDRRAREVYAPASYEGRRGARWWELPALRHWLARRLTRFAPDIVHAHLFHASLLVASIPRPGHARLVLSHQHGDHFHATGARVREQLDRLAGLRFDRVVGCSRSVEDYLLYRYGYSADRLSYVHNGWSGLPLAPRPEPARFDVICVARLRAQKRHRVLIDAMAVVKQHVPQARLRLVGDGEARAELEAHVRRAQLGDLVEFVGSAADVWPLLAEADVFALASSYEPLGIAAMEAMAAGLPVVASSVGGLRELVEDQVTGFLVSPGDERQLAARIVELLRDRERARTMGRRGREAAERFRSERTVEGYERVYRRLMDEPVAVSASGSGRRRRSRR